MPGGKRDYGADPDYTLLGERALDGWRRWNATWRTPRFHETGVMFLTRTAMSPGGFEDADARITATMRFARRSSSDTSRAETEP